MFKALIANPDQGRHDTKLQCQYYATEASILAGFERLFGFKCDVFAKILYINMADRKDHARIDFIAFISVFDGLLDEVQKKRNRCIFNLLDVNKRGELDILCLMQMFMNLERDTYFAQELLALIREHKLKNVLMTAGFKS